jgi:cathepsin D
LIIGPTEEVVKIQKAIGAVPIMRGEVAYYLLFYLSIINYFQYMVLCDKMATMPNVSMVINGRKFVLTPNDYVMKVCGVIVSYNNNA